MTDLDETTESAGAAGAVEPEPLPSLEQLLAKLNQVDETLGRLEKAVGPRIERIEVAVAAQTRVVHDLSTNLRLHGQYVQKLAELHHVESRLGELDEQMAARIEILKEGVDSMHVASSAMEELAIEPVL